MTQGAIAQLDLAVRPEGSVALKTSVSQHVEVTGG